MLARITIATTIAFVSLYVCGLAAFEGIATSGPPQTNTQFRLPKGLPETLWRRAQPKNNPITETKVRLGELLYFDKRLSLDGTVSCASCHDPANAFTDHDTVATGVAGRKGARNAPTILNSAFNPLEFWDGRASSLEEQAKQPLINPHEMGMPDHQAVVQRVSSVPQYREEFRQVFGREGITIDTIVKAIAAFERTQLSGNSPFDRFIAGDKEAISPSQRNGWELFKGKAHCTECHTFSASSPFFTDFKFHNTGIALKGRRFQELSASASEIKNTNASDGMALSALAHSDRFSDLGRYLVTKEPKDLGAFKTPTLRDIELTTPYMHDGSEKTLIDVVRLYNKGGVANPNLDRLMKPLHLTDPEIGDLVEFMRALTSDEVLKKTQNSTPQNRSPVPNY